jgi:hypothetical protein
MQTSEWSLIVSILAVIISIFSALLSAYISWTISKRQTALQEKLDEKETTLENRRFFTTALWDKMSDLNNISPTQPIGPDVRKAVNTLEAVSLCWQAGIVDKRMVIISFGHLFDELYNQIDHITGEVPGLRKTGHELLMQNPAVPLVHEEIRRELNKQGVIA